MKRNRWVIVVLLLLMPSIPVLAQVTADPDPQPQAQRRFELEEVVVTATRQEQEVRNIPRNVTVITVDDIEQATSNFVPDLLSREVGINLRSFYGTDKQAGVDIRGMGETSGSNVLVLVDGFRLNSPDLAGPDLSSVPIDEIERIEIQRGAASVVYGSGAVGGVINIITKRGNKTPYTRLSGAYGSYQTTDLRASGGGRLKNLYASVNASHYDTAGYRDNGDLKKKDVGFHAGYDATEYIRGDLLNSLLFTMTANYHYDEQGYPGGVSIQDIENRELRKKSSSPNDSAETMDRRLRGGIETDLSEWGLFKFSGGFRNRDNDFIYGFTPLKPLNEQVNHIDEDTKLFDAGYFKEYQLWGLSNKLQLGADYYYTDYISERLDQRERKNSQIKNSSFFFTQQSAIRNHLSLNLGYRYNIFDGKFRNDELEDFNGTDVWINGDEFDRNFYDNAYDVGLVYEPIANTSLFASYATSFRIPNVDEYALAEEDLEPQHGRHLDVGFRHRYGDLAEFSVTGFIFWIKDEIFFDADARLNRNFEDTTRRVGIETAVKLYPTDYLYLWVNYTYLEAKFESMDTWVPLVPRNSAALGIEWQVFDPLLIAITGNYVGKRFDGNDSHNNVFEELDPYQVYDIKVTYTYDKWRVFGGVNNLFDEFYSTVAFSESYFPMPTRNFYAGIQYGF